jgi:hypothetical protein
LVREGGGSVAGPDGLLAMLLAMGLVRQPEVIAWLCSLPGAGTAMNGLIEAAGLEPDENPFWHAEVRARGGARAAVCALGGMGDHFVHGARDPCGYWRRALAG